MPWYTTEHARRDAERQRLKKCTNVTKQDRQLIELAAKAIGLSVFAERKDWLIVLDLQNGGQIVAWNPLEDDGDAARLAGKLQISVMYQVSGVEAHVYKGKRHIAHEPVSYETEDVNRATRFAITKAAAHVGEGRT